MILRRRLWRLQVNKRKPASGKMACAMIARALSIGVMRRLIADSAFLCPRLRNVRRAGDGRDNKSAVKAKRRHHR